MVFSRRNKGTANNVVGSTSNIPKAPPSRSIGAGNNSNSVFNTITTKKRSNSTNGSYPLGEEDGASTRPSSEPDGSAMYTSDEELMMANSSNANRPLASFDACVETVDTMAAASSSSTLGFGRIAADNLWRRTPTIANTTSSSLSLAPDESNDTTYEPKCTNATTTSIDDCSVCVSPDGLIITNAAMVISDTYDLDLDSSVVVGYDGPGNDRLLNGFSARCWSTTATSQSLRQCVDALQATGRFAQSICKAKHTCATTVRDASRKLFDDIWDSAAFSPKTTFLSSSHSSSAVSTATTSLPSNSTNTTATTSTTATAAARKKYSTTSSATTVEPSQQIQDPKDDFNVEIKGRDGTIKRAMRMGPLLQPGTTLNQALTAVEAYYSKLSLIECNRWKYNADGPISGDGGGEGGAVVSSIMAAAQRTKSRGEKRELALQEAIARAEQGEVRLSRKKAVAQRKWAIYNDAMNSVRERIMDLEKERETERLKEKEKERSKLMKDKFVSTKLTMTQQPVPKDVLQIVSQVAETADFAPTTPNVELNPIGHSTAILPVTSPIESPSLVSFNDRAELELKFGIAEKRLAAIEADNAVEDAAGALLNALSSLDTTKRSARIAAEACLLSAANKQKQSLSALVKVEKEALLEQLTAIEQLQDEVDAIDVRADLNLYIEQDKRYPGGRTECFRDDNDDGGIASALAVLNCHSFSTGANELSILRGSVLEGWGSEEKDGIVAREEIEDYIDILFQEEEDAMKRNGEDIDAAVSFLVNAVKDPCEVSRTHRAYVCYALNAKRSKQTEIKGEKQFDGLCQVISALLSACGSSSGDIANSKMCMMLAQTFFMVKCTTTLDDAEPRVGCDGNDSFTDSNKRQQRIFVKSKLIGHSLWNDDDFWDHALYQCISEALTQSEVMHNLQRAAIAFHTGSLDEISEEALNRVKWHDFPPEQRAEAAVQLHSVVFAQLGALSHSMLEFGCSFTKAVAFVRRSAVRHQLPISKRTTLLQHLEERIHSEKTT